jgi:hypothetical protein
MTTITKTSLMLIMIMLAVLAGFAIGSHTNQSMWENSIQYK